MPDSPVKQIIQSVDQLRPMPGSVTRVLKAIEDPMSTAGLVAELIGLDQALAAILLQMANSVGLGFGTTCTTLSQAVIRLGFKRIKVLVLGAAVNGPLMRRLPGYRIGGGELWNHGVATASAAQWLARIMFYPDAEEAYVVGLLHDMGKLLLDQFVLSDYTEIMSKMRTNHLSLWQAEIEKIGIDHATVGGLMAEKWNFPSNLIDPIKYHHSPAMAMEKEKLAAIINIANAIASKPENELIDMADTTAHPEAYRILGFEDNAIERLRKQYINAIKMR